MKNGEKINRSKKSNKNKLFNNKLFTPIQLQKIENIYEANSSSNKTAIILYKKSPNKNILLNHNKNQHNNIKLYNSKSKEKKNKTLNNTYHRKNEILNKNYEGKKIKILRTEVKSKIISEFKMLNNRIYSPINKSSNKHHKINFSTEKRNKTPIKNINNCLIHNKIYDISPSYKINKNKKSYSKNRNKNYDFNFKTFYNDKSNHKKKIYSIYEKRKDSIPKEKSFIIKRNKSFNEQNHIKNSKSKKHNTSHFHRRKSNDVDNIKFDEFFNTFNNTHTHKKEINSYSYYNPNNSTSKKHNKKIEKENKPHVDTLEYLTKIINSKKSNNLTNMQNEIKNNKNTNKNQESFINAFRKKNNEKKRLSNEKSDIKKYIQVKKKLYKLNNIKKKKKEKEEELKKYLELYKLERNISNSNNNTFYHSSKTQNIFNETKKWEEYNDDNYICNKNSNEFLSSIDSTIVDKNNFYEGIIDIQKIYSNNIINNNIIINNYPKSETNCNQENNIHKCNKRKDDICNNNQNNKKINSRNQKEPYNNNLKNNEIMIDNKIANIKNELKEEKIDEIAFTYFSPKKGEKKGEEIENKKEIIKPEDDFNKANVLQINQLNEYSFRLNNSNSESNEAKENNDINSFTTSKFCNSQLLSEQNSQSNKNILLNEKELKEEKEKENNMNEKNISQENKKYTFTKEELDNYKEILSSLFDYLKLITQRNALNDIISYGDMKYKYKIGFEIILTLIKLAPFNIIRAIQQSQYYHFAFRQLFIPYITKCFRKLKLFCYYDKLFENGEKKLKFIYKKIVINKIKRFNREKNFEEINEILNLDNKNLEILSDKDISESKDNDLIDWEDSFFSDKQEINNVISENDIVNKK